ncbi:MAG: hypothetical protein NVSMB14_00210 [Isosphaeraceae bacterium]
MEVATQPRKRDQARRAVRESETRRVWRPVLLLGAVVFVCWALPALSGHGPYGHGLIRLVHIYTGIFAVPAWVASLAVALAPVRYRRPLALRMMAVLVALFVAVPLGDLASTLWSVRVGHFWYYSMCFSRSVNAPDPELIWKRKPDLVWRGRKTPYCDEVDYRTDENGFRNPAGIRRADVVVIGDSVTEAGELDANSTFVPKTGAALGLQAVNLGTSGYGPQQELAVLRRYGLTYKPRLVVWQVTEWNDLNDAQAYQMRDHPLARTLPNWDNLYTRHSPMMRLVSAILPGGIPNSLEFLESDGRVEKQMFWPYRPNPHELLPEGFAETRRAIATAFEICRARNIDFVVLYVPSHIRVLLPYLRFKSETERNRFCSGGVVDREDDLSHALTDFCLRLGCPIIDMAPRLRSRAAVDNRRIYIHNDPHLGVDGHDEVRNALVGFVESRGKIINGAAARRR